MPNLSTRVAVLALVLLLATVRARADKLDALTRTLMTDRSYKVRVQAAAVLGKLGDRRAVPVLIQALRDENDTVRGVAATSLGYLGDRAAAAALMQVATGDSSDFVRRQAQKALEQVAAGSEHQVAPRPGARFYVAIAFRAGGPGGPDSARIVRDALTRELQKVPSVTLSSNGDRRLRGFVVDGSIVRLSASPMGGQSQIDCDLRAFVATLPDKSIKMTTTEGASLQVGASPSEQLSAKRDCLTAAAEALREDVAKFLHTQE